MKRSFVLTLIITAVQIGLNFSNEVMGQKVAAIGINKFINDEFANNPFEERLTSEKLEDSSGIAFSLHKQPIENTHSGDMDTLLHYSAVKSRITFYKNSRSLFLYSAQICDGDIRLNKGISVGMDKQKVLQHLGIPPTIKADTIKITDSEDYSAHIFLFANDVLKEVNISTGH